MSDRPSSLSRKLAAAIDKIVDALAEAVRPVAGPQAQLVRVRTQSRGVRH